MTWRGFQLHPEVPAGGAPVASLFGASRARKFRDYMRGFAGEFGVDIGDPDRIPCTLRPLAMTEYARDHGALVPVRDALMAAHWLEGEDIESDDVLRHVAAGAGLDAEAALSAADDPAYLGRIADARVDAHDAMVTGIPTLILPGGYPVVGCQRWETVDLVARKVGLPARG